MNSPRPAAAPPLVLVVEDDEKNRKLARDVLQHHGYAVRTADSAEEGIAATRERRPDLVLLDIQLPGMSGIQAIGVLRSIPGMERVPVVAFTASVMPSERQQVLAAGFDGFVFKPVTLAELLGTVGRCLAGAGGSA